MYTQYTDFFCRSIHGPKMCGHPEHSGHMYLRAANKLIKGYKCLQFETTEICSEPEDHWCQELLLSLVRSVQCKLTQDTRKP